MLIRWYDLLYVHDGEKGESQVGWMKEAVSRNLGSNFFYHAWLEQFAYPKLLELPGEAGEVELPDGPGEPVADVLLRPRLRVPRHL